MTTINEVYVCDCGADGEWAADNNANKMVLWYCDDCEDKRAELYGCARIIAEGCGCFPGPEDCFCGCGGTGMLE